MKRLAVLGAALGVSMAGLGGCSTQVTLETLAQGTWECTGAQSGVMMQLMAGDEYDEVQPDPDDWQEATAVSAEVIDAWFQEVGMWEVTIKDRTWTATFIPAATARGQEEARWVKPESGTWTVTADGVTFIRDATDAGYENTLYEVLGVPQDSPDQFRGSVTLVQTTKRFDSNAGEDELVVSWVDGNLVITQSDGPYLSACRKSD